jgi:choline kinase/phosphatidylglycerophosphate synthase
MDALILAAGDGTRLQPLTDDKPKVMIDIWNVPVLERVLFSLKEAGIKRAVIVVGYKKEAVKDYFASEWRGMEIVYREVENWEDGILKSAVMGEEVIKERFVFLCGDTILEPETITRALEVEGDLVFGALDARIDESVGALVGKDGHVERIGMLKEMEEWNRVVTGMAVCEPDFFKAIRACMEKKIYDRPCAMQWMVDEGYDVKAFDMTEDPWWEIDDHSDLDRAREEIFARAWRKRLKPRDINVFKRLFNLPVSLRLVRLAAPTGIKPDHMTLASLCLALLAGLAFSFEHFVIGGILSYACAMADAMDGKISRLKLIGSQAGAFHDSVADRMAEIAIVAGLAWGLFRQSGDSLMVGLGLLGVLGWLGRFYLKEVFIDVAGLCAWKGLKPLPLDLLGHRDVSFFMTMIFCILGYPLVPLLWMAFFGNLFSTARLVQYSRYLSGLSRKSSGTPVEPPPL